MVEFSNQRQQNIVLHPTVNPVKSPRAIRFAGFAILVGGNNNDESDPILNSRSFSLDSDSLPSCLLEGTGPIDGTEREFTALFPNGGEDFFSSKLMSDGSAIFLKLTDGQPVICGGHVVTANVQNECLQYQGEFSRGIDRKILFKVMP